MRSGIFAVLFMTLTGFLSSHLLQAQQADFQTVNRLIQQQEYEEALPMLEELHREHPGASIFFDHLVEALIYLKRYEEALHQIEARIEAGFHSSSLMIRKGAIYHLTGEREQALEVWNQVAEDAETNMQIYFQLGNVLIERREFDEAVRLYNSARESFDDETLFINELANAHMQSGNFRQAMAEYFRLIERNPNQLSFVQQQLLRASDDNLYRIAALEFEERILQLDQSHQAYHQLHQLYIWLLTETEQFERAYNAAHRFESASPVINYALWSLGSRFLSSRQFELAAEAFHFYTELSDDSVRSRALDELSRTWKMWADYLDSHNLESLQHREELYRKAYDGGMELLDLYPDYERRGRVMVRSAELALEQFGDRELADQWAERLESDDAESYQGEIHYLYGRSALMEGRYDVARQEFARAGRAEGDTDLAERARYYASFGDFLSGEFEFAQIQLRALERQEVSFYANDALKLRMWIQQGLRSDTTGRELSAFAEVLEQLHKGDFTGAFESWLDLEENYQTPLVDNALAELASRSDIRHLPLLFPAVYRHNRNFPSSPLRERMLWEEAVMAEMLMEAGGRQGLETAGGSAFNGEEFLKVRERIGEKGWVDQADWPESQSDLESLYEAIIMEFPQGFYAPYAREKLRSLEQLSELHIMTHLDLQSGNNRTDGT